MPRGRKPKKTVDLITRLESMATDASMPLAMREHAARELIRLSPPALEPKPPAPTPVMPDWSALIAAEAALKEQAKMTKPEAKPVPVNPSSESQEFAHDAEIAKRPVPPSPPEPIERQPGMIFTVGGCRYRYMCYDAATKQHLLTAVIQTNIGLPEITRVSEERLTNKQYASRPRDRVNCETVEECRARLDAEQARESYKWNLAMHKFGNDPEGC
jgi:hypothetical protein